MATLPLAGKFHKITILIFEQGTIMNLPCVNMFSVHNEGENIKTGKIITFIKNNNEKYGCLTILTMISHKVKL